MRRPMDLTKYEPLKNPRITTIPDQKVIVVTTKGDPNVIGKEAFGVLFKSYFRIKGVAKGGIMPAPRARWPIDQNTPMSEWTGKYAMAIPESIMALPKIKTKSGIEVKIDTWQYGEVAEILHIGPYEKEKPTVEKLMKFIEERGYHPVGEHEEEYIKGPGMFFKGNPEKYYTIIRYRVEKNEP